MPAARAHTTVTQKLSPTRAAPTISREQLFSHTLTNQHPHNAITRLAQNTRELRAPRAGRSWDRTRMPTYGCVTDSQRMSGGRPDVCSTRVVVGATSCARHADCLGGLRLCRPAPRCRLGRPSGPETESPPTRCRRGAEDPPVRWCGLRPHCPCCGCSQAQKARVGRRRPGRLACARPRGGRW